LNKWIPAKTFASFLISPNFPEGKCVVPNAPSGGAAGAASGALKKVTKHLELRKKRISKGFAAYFFDQVDYFLLNQFEEDVKESWKGFWNNADAAHKGDVAKMDGLLNTESLNKTIVDSKWSIAPTLDVVTLIR